MKYLDMTIISSDGIISNFYHIDVMMCNNVMFALTRLKNYNYLQVYNFISYL